MDEHGDVYLMVVQDSDYDQKGNLSISWRRRNAIEWW